MADRPPVIIGFDAVSPLGIDLDIQWRRALSGKSGVGPLTRFAPPPEFPVQVAGQVDAIDHLDYPFLKPREQARWVSPIFKYALLTVQRALEKSGLVITKELAPKVAVTFSSAIGGLDAVLTADRDLLNDGRLPKPFINPNACINMVGGKVAMLTKATGPIFAGISACATGLTSLLTGVMLLEQKRAEVVICGAVDFPLVEPIVAGFYTMNAAYSPKEGRPPIPPAACSRPFSVDRRGFIISEGSGCLLLCTREFARANHLDAPIEIAGWSMTADAHHHVAPRYDTVRRCIFECLENAGLKPEEIDAVNAHATATKSGDQVEADALLSVFDQNVPPVTANKSLFGHAMGASSAIESILAITAMLTETLPPTINHRPDPAIPLDCVTEGPRRVVQEHVLKNAFGFGGHNACVVLRRIR
jgi:3-oxoacyl-[acyl-carrier-protein] synthase II